MANGRIKEGFAETGKGRSMSKELDRLEDALRAQQVQPRAEAKASAISEAMRAFRGRKNFGGLPRIGKRGASQSARGCKTNLVEMETHDDYN